MADQKSRHTRIEGAANAAAVKGMTPAIETIQAFAREIAQMSGQALVCANQHIEKHRKAQRIEEAAAIQVNFLKESLEHAAQHTRKYIEMQTTFPHELGKRGGRDGRGSQAPHCGEGRAPFRRCPFACQISAFHAPPGAKHDHGITPFLSMERPH